jgi:hypothetical protein
MTEPSAIARRSTGIDIMASTKREISVSIAPR